MRQLRIEEPEPLAAIRLRHAHPAGMTLIELLFVILVIGMLVSLLLPALQNSRTSSRQLRCTKNMTQLILAVKLYQEVHEYFPAGVVENAAGPIRSQAVGYHHSWISQILPQLNEQAAFRSIDFRVGAYHPKQAAVRTLVMLPLVCPSFGGNGTNSNYAAVHNDVEQPIDSNNNGSFFLNSFLRPEDIEDGLGHTLFIGEMTPFRGSLGWMSGTRATMRNLGKRLGRTAIDGSGIPWVVSTRKMPKKLLPKLEAVGGFGGIHKGITPFAFGDGRVQKISNFTDRRVLRQLANRQDGAPLDLPTLRSSNP